jgi:putative membrane protein
MFAALLNVSALNPSPDIWQFRAHPEVWFLVLGLAVAYIYTVRVIGPKMVPSGTPVITPRQRNCFIAGLGLLWLVSDYPIHDLAEQYLYSVHMFQHMAMSYFVPPLMLLATPTWMARLLIGDGKVHRGIRFMSSPVVAGVAFNGWLMVTHIPYLVNLSSTNGVLHYVLHFVLVFTSLMMWMPLCGPLPEFRRGPGAQMIYLFAMSVVPTVPAAWLTFAERAVYKVYDHPVRAFNMTVADDQQTAGVIMKIGGSAFLWVLIALLFFKRFMPSSEDTTSFRKLEDVVPLSSQQLTYGEVTDAFSQSEPAYESRST